MSKDRRYSYNILFAVFIVLMLFAANDVHAQWTVQALPPPDVLRPEPSRWWLGPQAGVNLNTHEGDFFTEFCECSFKDGSGVGITAGFEIGHMLSPSIGIAVKLLYNDLQAQYAYKLRIPTQVVDPDEVLVIEHERKNDVRLGYLMLHPVVQLHPFSFIYFFAGPAIGIRTTATQAYTQIADPAFEYPVGNPAERAVVDDSGELPRSESFRADVRAGIGLNLRIGRSLRLAPEVSYGLPLTTISDDDDWKAQAIHATVVLKFDL